MADNDGATTRPSFATRREVLASLATGAAAITAGATSGPFQPETYGVGYYGVEDYGGQ